MGELGEYIGGFTGDWGVGELGASTRGFVGDSGDWGLGVVSGSGVCVNLSQTEVTIVANAGEMFPNNSMKHSP